VVERLVKVTDHLKLSRSYTSRAPRGDEVDGVDYNFVSRNEFQQRIERRELRQTEAALEQRAFNEQEELSVLASMIAAKRRQQGIVAPMDG